MNFKRAYFYTLSLILFTAIGFAGGYIVNSLTNDSLAHWSILNQAYKILEDHGLNPLPDEPAIEYGMIRGMVQAYNDPYTTFVEPVQHELESNTLQGSFGGIGVRLGRDGDGNIVLYPFPDSPAEKAGVIEGDRLLAVDGEPMPPETPIETTQAALRGPVGEWVEIEISRPPDYETIRIRIKRAEIPLPSVTWHIDPDEPRLGIIELNIIAASTSEEIKSAVEDLRQRGAEFYLLDLRDNYGGLLSAGVDTARLFLKDGEIIHQKYRGQDTETYRVEKPGQLADIPLAVLVNQNTASAAEIIAGSLQVNSRAKLIGTPTYGKDTIQLVFDLNDGSSIHVTAAQWWIPGLDHPLAGSGLQPDLLVEFVETDGPDPMIQAATQSLLGRIKP
jgi:carboxyl-terminal processing protease